MGVTGKRIIGAALIILAVVSLIVTVFGITQVWQLKEPLEEYISSAMDLTSSTLGTTYDALTVLDGSLEAVIVSVSGLQTTVETLAKSIEDSAPLVSSLATLTGDVLPGAVTSAQTSLESAQASATVIDTVLRALTIFNRSAYDPEVTIDVALGRVSESLNDLPESLSQMETSLTSTQENMETIQAEIGQIAENIGDIQTGLEDGQQVIEQYQELLQQMQAGLERWQARLPDAINTLAWLFTFILVWLGITQIGIFLQGLDMVRSKKRSE